MSEFNAGVRAAVEVCRTRGHDTDLATRHILADAIEALLRPEPAPEPVAWQRLKPGRTEWQIIDAADVSREMEMGHEVRPLYAHPAPTCTAQTGPAAACVYREPLLRTAAHVEKG